jgi:hypothetical protein
MKIIDYHSNRSIAFKLRQKRGKRIIDLIEQVYGSKQRVDIADIGGTREYWNIIPEEYLLRKHVHITIVNISLPSDRVGDSDGIFSYFQGDGCDLKGIEADQFDIAHSNSVIEHVGGWENMVYFAKEIRRIAAIYYVQTPNYYFPIEPHFLFPFFHWLPVPARLCLAMRFSWGCFPKAKNVQEAGSYVKLCQLLTKKNLLGLFPDARLYRERLFLMVKSFVMIKNSLG